MRLPPAIDVVFARRHALVWLLPCALVVLAQSAWAQQADEGGVDPRDETVDADAEADEDDVVNEKVAVDASFEVSATTAFDLSAFAKDGPLGPGLAAAKAGRHAAVVALCRPLWSHGDRDVATAAAWLTVRAAGHLGDDHTATAALERLAVGGALADRARLLLAGRAQKVGDNEAALRWLAAVGDSHPDAGRAQLERAALHLDRGEIAAADVALRQLRAERLSAAERARAELLRGDIARRGGQRDLAVAAYRRAWGEGEAPYDDAALERLAALGKPPGAVERVERLLEQPVLRGRPSGSRARRARRAALLTRLDQIAADTAGLADYAHGMLASHDRGQRELALELFGRAIHAATDPNFKALAGLRRGDLLGKMDRDAEAVTELEAALALAVDAPLVHKLSWRLQRLYAYLGRNLDAERLLNALHAAGPTSAYHLHTLWALAWRRFQLGDLAEAARYLGQLDARAGAALTGSRQPWRAKVGYWLGRVHAQGGAEAAARGRWLDVARRWPPSYYGLLARDRLEELDPAAAAYVAGSAPPHAEEAPPLRLADVHLPRHPNLGEVALLVRLQDFESARNLLHELLPRGLPAGAVQLLAALFAVQGRERAALAVLQRYVRRAGRPDQATLALWRGAFPTPYGAAFDKAARESGIAKSLLYAIARTESSFVARAESGAGALGLTQVLPPVARKVASLWGLRDPGRAGLFRPESNVAIGARYLAELASMYRGNMALVAVAYNAGPYAARRWLPQAMRPETDAYLEALPSSGARAYAMTVVATAATYAYLYPDWQEGPRMQAGRPARVPDKLGPFMVGQPVPLSAAEPAGVAADTVAAR